MTVSHHHLSAEAARLQSRHHLRHRGTDSRPHQPLTKRLVEDEVAERAVERGQLRLVDRVKVHGASVSPTRFPSGSEGREGAFSR